MTECCDPFGSPGYLMRPDESKEGECFVKTGPRFDFVKITNSADHQNDNVLIQAVREYRPTVAVFLKGNNFYIKLKLKDTSRIPVNGFWLIKYVKNTGKISRCLL